MAGITNGTFCRKFTDQGFDMVTIGGYNVDPETINAGHRILERGRSEFDVPLKDILNHLDQQINIIKKNNSWDGMISVNIRSVTASPVIEISKIDGVDVVEINAHCRQPEIMDLGCGQALLHYPDKLYKFVEEVVRKAESKVSVKIRCNVPGVDETVVSKAVENAGSDFLHVDAMKPDYPEADYKLISHIKKKTDIFLIGNNSIKDIESAQKMVKAGADGISIARALINGKVPFDLSLINF